MSMGVRQAAIKHNIKPQTLYQRIYYKYGLTVKGLKEKMKAEEVLPPVVMDGEEESTEEDPPSR